MLNVNQQQSSGENLRVAILIFTPDDGYLLHLKGLEVLIPFQYHLY